MDDEPRIQGRWDRRRQEVERAEEDRRAVEREWERDAARRQRTRERNDEAALRCAALEQRVAILESQNSELRSELAALRSDLHEVAAATSTAIETVGDSHLDLNRSTRDEIRELKIETAKLRESFATWREERAGGATRPCVEDDTDIIRKTRVN
jgi:chromosome segregation ATPase